MVPNQSNLRKLLIIKQEKGSPNSHAKGGAREIILLNFMTLWGLSVMPSFSGVWVDLAMLKQALGLGNTTFRLGRTDLRSSKSKSQPVPPFSITRAPTAPSVPAFLAV